MAAIPLPIQIQIDDLEPVEKQLEEYKEAYVILKELFAVPEVSDVRACRFCHCPVLHMEHLNLEAAKSLEERARALLIRVEPEAYAKPGADGEEL
jgi:hypothetical protein